jgi:hypothetical protein
MEVIIASNKCNLINTAASSKEIFYFSNPVVGEDGTHISACIG